MKSVWRPAFGSSPTNDITSSSKDGNINIIYLHFQMSSIFRLVLDFGSVVWC